MEFTVFILMFHLCNSIFYQHKAHDILSYEYVCVCVCFFPALSHCGVVELKQKKNKSENMFFANSFNCLIWNRVFSRQTFLSL